MPTHIFFENGVGAREPKNGYVFSALENENIMYYMSRSNREGDRGLEVTEREF